MDITRKKGFVSRTYRIPASLAKRIEKSAKKSKTKINPHIIQVLDKAVPK